MAVPPPETIDLDRWPRASHFRFFRDFADPHFMLVADVDITALHAAAGARGISRFAAMLHAVCWAAHAVPAFRLRMRGPDTVVRHARVHPSFTALLDGENFEYRRADYDPDFARFAAGLRAELARPAEGVLRPGPLAQDDLLFVSCVPWVHFTGMKHASWQPRSDSFPRLCWGRFTTGADGRVRTSVSAQVHHGLADGVHVGRFFAALEARAAAVDWLVADETGPGR